MDLWIYFSKIREQYSFLSYCWEGSKYFCLTLSHNLLIQEYLWISWASIKVILKKYMFNTHSISFLNEIQRNLNTMYLMILSNYLIPRMWVVVKLNWFGHLLIFGEADWWVRQVHFSFYTFTYIWSSPQWKLKNKSLFILLLTDKWNISWIQTEKTVYHIPGCPSKVCKTAWNAQNIKFSFAFIFYI